MNKTARVLIATPTHDGSVFNTGAIVDCFLTPGLELAYEKRKSSLLAHSRNLIWRSAIDADVDWLVMIDADVEPVGTGWLNKLLTEAAVHNAPVLGAVIPLKEDSGDTSTAMYMGDWEAERYGRAFLSLNPDHTWTHRDLLVSTGLLLVNMVGSWVHNIKFTIQDRIEPNGEIRVWPEDWDFCRQCHKMGIKVWATTKIPVIHWDGGTAYRLTGRQ